MLYVQILLIVCLLVSYSSTYVSSVRTCFLTALLLYTRVHVYVYTHGGIHALKSADPLLHGSMNGKAT